MNKPSQAEIINHLCDHFGLTLTQVLEAIKTPMHPATMRDEFAALAMSFTFDLAHIEASAALAYQVADAMLAERTKAK